MEMGDLCGSIETKSEEEGAGWHGAVVGGDCGDAACMGVGISRPLISLFALEAFAAVDPQVS